MRDCMLVLKYLLNLQADTMTLFMHHVFRIIVVIIYTLQAMFAKVCNVKRYTYEQNKYFRYYKKHKE
jgi:hypothetical protein